MSQCCLFYCVPSPLWKSTSWISSKFYLLLVFASILCIWRTKLLILAWLKFLVSIWEVACGCLATLDVSMTYSAHFIESPKILFVSQFNVSLLSSSLRCNPSSLPQVSSKKANKSLMHLLLHLMWLSRISAMHFLSKAPIVWCFGTLATTICSHCAYIFSLWMAFAWAI